MAKCNAIRRVAADALLLLVWLLPACGGSQVPLAWSHENLWVWQADEEIAVGDDVHSLLALDLQSGRELWRMPGICPPTDRAPVPQDHCDWLAKIILDDDRVIVATWTAVRILDSHSGRVLFHRSTEPKTGFGTHVMALIRNTLLIDEQRGVVALDAATGDVRWSMPGVLHGVVGELAFVSRLEPSNPTVFVEAATGDVVTPQGIPQDWTLIADEPGWFLYRPDWREQAGRMRIIRVAGTAINAVEVPRRLEPAGVTSTCLLFTRTTGDGEEIMCLDPSSGNRRWGTFLDAPFTIEVIDADGMVVVPQLGARKDIIFVSTHGDVHHVTLPGRVQVARISGSYHRPVVTLWVAVGATVSGPLAPEYLPSAAHQ